MGVVKETADQLRAITAVGQHICVDAGAGSGKTRVLVDRMIHLVERKRATLSEIAAITFTDKAAAEMKDRFRKVCRERADTTDAQTMTRWRNVEKEILSARIGTIHSFCGGILRENALALGLDPEFKVLDEAEASLLRNRHSPGVRARSCWTNVTPQPTGSRSSSARGRSSRRSNRCCDAAD